jgi:radical SAM superfamily enzyme YgiQ (UPF0313 family)
VNWLLTTCVAPIVSPFFTHEKRPPLGLGFLISVLRQAGHQVFLIDNYLTQSDFLETDYLISNKIDIVGISVNSLCYRDFLHMAYALQKMRKNGTWKGKIVVGGPHVSVMPESIPDFVDHIVIGEGEQAVLEICNDTAQRIIKCPFIKDLDSLPPPSWEDFTNLPYDWSLSWLEVKPVFSMNTSRGCPFHCTFCSVNSAWGTQYRLFSAGRIVNDIKYVVHKYGCKGIYFREDNFTVDKRRVERFCELLLYEGLQIQWACETRVDILDRELIKLMHQSGCRAFYIGVESGSQRLLDFMNKGITIQQIESVFDWCDEIGVKKYASFIVGIPTETPYERQESKILCERIKPTTHAFNIFVGIPKSQMYNYVLANKLYEYIDNRGLVYLKGHNLLVDEFYGGDERRKIPWPFQEHYVQSLDLLQSGDRIGAFKEAIQAIFLSPFNKKLWRFMPKVFLPLPMLNIIRAMRRLLLLLRRQIM